MNKENNTSNDIVNRVIDLIAAYTSVNKKNIELNSDLRDELGIDSFAAVELAFRLKEEFGVPISSNELPKLRTVNDIIEGIKKNLKIK